MYKQVNIANTYACKNAIKISKPVNATINVKGKTPVKNGIDTTNPAKTFSKVWPASMFANSLTDRLIGRDKYDITSMGIKRGCM